MYEFEKIEEA